MWLLEVNGSPAAAERMTPALAADVVELAIDKMYPPGGAGGGTAAGGGITREGGGGGAGGREGGDGADTGVGAGAGAAAEEAAAGGAREHPRWADISSIASCSLSGEGGAAVDAGPPTPPKVD